MSTSSQICIFQILFTIIQALVSSMTKLFENEYGFYISHKEYINELYRDMDKPLEINPKLFQIKCQYKLHKNDQNTSVDCNQYENQEEQENIKSKFSLFMNDFLQKHSVECQETANKEALETARLVYGKSGKSPVNNVYGANIGPAIIKAIEGSNFVFPENCTFYSKDVSNIKEHLMNEKYDLILLDPPWWNKYIRRKRKKCGDAYNMMFNDDIMNLPIESLLKEKGMVIVWCTNSQQHINDLLTKIFPKWNVKFVAKWYWMKVTLNGKPICSFSLPPGKQPYEQIILGCRGDLCTSLDSKVVVSVPSAIHSHKPPLMELVKPFLPKDPQCLEIFARYLLPNWTSYGNEVLRLQHESLFV